MVKGFSTIWCYVTEMDRSVRFYRDVLGMTPEMISPYWSQFKLGQGALALHPTGKDHVGPTGEYGKGWFIGLEVDDIRKFRAKLEASGAEIKGDYHDVPNAVVLDFVDPDGNTLEAYQAGIRTSEF